MIDERRKPEDKWAKQDEVRRQVNAKWLNSHPEKERDVHKVTRKQMDKEEGWVIAQQKALDHQHAQEEMQRRIQKDHDDKRARDSRARDRNDKGGGLRGLFNRHA